MIRRQQEFTKSSLPGCLAPAVSPSGKDDFAPMASAHRSFGVRKRPAHVAQIDLVVSRRRRNGAEVFPVVACPTPNLGSDAHAAGISEAKGAQPSGRLAAPLRAVPEGA